ncbi:unnamed protein product [Lactuca virosa]|uniref:BED-type domain-containing protein n=1 Tax=Lactuca virosa TaxID=75947 RepID=A0AAU9N0I4_9ASTR|nr:unnamed protein product [Lactuca virosa]
MHKPNFSGNPVKRKCKLTSRVWKAFEILKESDSKGNMLCKCKKCGTTYIAESSHGTGNLLRHKRACDLKHKSYKDVGQLLIQSNLKGSLGTRSATFKADEFRELVAVAIARHNLPFQFVEYEAFTSMPPPHNGASLAERVCGLLKQWGIDKKIVSITLDNASANDSMANALKFDLNLMSDGDYFHVRCCAHILNLIVQDGLKELDGAIVKVRDIVKYCKGSQSRKKSFLRSVQYAGLESTRGLRQDVPTCWNSTYHMLDSALYKKKAILHLAKTDANYVHCPSFEEWSRIEKFCNFLQVFHDVTLAFSALLWALPLFFYPRYKFHFIEWAFKKIYGSSFVVELDLFKKKLFSLFDEYAAVSATTKTNESSSHSGVANDKSDTYMTDFDDFFSCEFTTGGKSELQSYLEEPKLPRTGDLNVLEYCKHLQGRFNASRFEALCKQTLTMKIGDVNEDESDVPSTPSIQTQHSGLG